jgi:hypothetical protein
MIVSEIRLRFNKFATMKIKSYKDGNKVKKYVSSGKEKKAVLGTIIAGAGAVSDIIAGERDYRLGKAEAQRRQQEIDRLKATAPSLETPAAFRQATKDAYDRTLLEAQKREINRQLGTSVGALGQAGGRALLGGIGAATQQAALAGQTAAQAQAKTQLEALSQLGQAELQTQSLREQRYQTELATQREMKQLAEQAAGAGMGSMIGGIGSAALLGTGAFGGFGENVQQGLLFDGTNINKKKKTTETTPDPEVKQTSGDESIDERLKQIENAISRREYSREKGGVMKTKGDFSHKTNPIDLVQNGEKVGEATGGEYIFNPEQSKKMKKLAEEASNARSEGKRTSAMKDLAKFVRKLLKRFEKDVK